MIDSIRSGGLFDVLFNKESVDMKSTKKSLAISAALVAITAVAAYLCITHGLPGLDAAHTSLSRVSCSLLVGAGAFYGLAAVANTAFLFFGAPNFSSSRILEKQKAIELKQNKTMGYQTFLSLFAPLALPIALVSTSVLCQTSNPSIGRR